MTLEQYAYLGEIIAAVAVVVSLLYLAIQIRQNTKAVRTSNFHGITDSFNQINNTIANDESLARIFHVGMADFSQLNEDEKIRFNFMFLSAFRVMETLYYQSTQGVAEQQLWLVEQQTIKALLSGPGTLEWWSSNPLSLTPGFRKFVDENILQN